MKRLISELLSLCLGFPMLSFALAEEAAPLAIDMSK